MSTKAATTTTTAPAKKVEAPTTLLKKRRTAAQVRARKVANVLKAKKKTQTQRKEYFKRAEQYVREYRAAENALVAARRQAKREGNFFVEPEAKLAFVIRIRGINGVSPKVRKVLRLLRLRQLHNATFVKINAATIQLIRLAEPYIAWGYPSLRTVKELVYKRGYAKVNGQRIPITDNSIIEKHLGRFNIICVEDLIHEIFTVGKNFKFANKFLWPFKLNSPRGGFTKIRTHFMEGGASGNHEDLLNDLIRRMN